jgi:hypothetical protein
MKSFSNFHFKGQKPEEQILLVLHRHWFDILTRFVLVFFMSFVLFGSFAFLPVFFSQLRDNPANNLFLFLQSLFLMFTWIVSFIIWIDYYFDVWIVTDQRIINIEQMGLFSRSTSELELEKVQDITTDIKGVLKTLLDFGDLQVQTAAEQEKFLFHNIPNPNYVKDLIMKLQKKQEHTEEKIFAKMITEKIHHEDSV